MPHRSLARPEQQSLTYRRFSPAFSLFYLGMTAFFGHRYGDLETTIPVMFSILIALPLGLACYHHGSVRVIVDAAADLVRVERRYWPLPPFAASYPLHTMRTAWVRHGRKRRYQWIVLGTSEGDIELPSGVDLPLDRLNAALRERPADTP